MNRSLSPSMRRHGRVTAPSGLSAKAGGDVRTCECETSPAMRVEALRRVTMLRHVLLAAAIAAIVAVPVSAQTADEIIAKNLEAKGGAAKLKAVQSVRMTGTMLVGPGMSVPIVLELKRPRSMRMDLTIQGMTMTQAFDGSAGWMLNPMSGRTDPEPLPSDAMKLVEEQADMDGPFVDYKEKGNAIELLGKEKVGDVECFKIKVTLKSGDTRVYYIDVEKFLEVKQESKTKVRDTDVENDTIIGDWKDVDGLMFPFSIDSGQPGAPMRQKMTVTKIEINPTIDETRFKMPIKQ
jgi:outer membrane lipoprotein-sorting protein